MSKANTIAVQGGQAPALAARELAYTIQERWHALGHVNVRVWTEPRTTKMRWLNRDGTIQDGEFHTHEIVSNLINGLPPAGPWIATSEVPTR